MRHKPAEAVDAWFDAEGAKHPEPMTLAGTSEANRLYPFHSDPRVVAGAPLANDVLKCRLKRADARDYRVRFTSSQFARLERILPQGVYDFSKPGLDKVRLKGTYQRY